MADEREKLEAEKEITKAKQQQVSATREAKTLSEEDLEIQRRIRDTQFGIVEELKEQLGVRTRLSEQDRTTLNLSRQITSTLLESNRELRRAGKLESQILREKRLLAKAQQTLNDSFSQLTATSYEQLETILAIAETTGLADEAYTKFLTTINEADRALVNQLVLGKVQMTNIGKSLELRDKELDKQKDINKSLGLAGALTDNLQRIGLRAFGGLGINLGVFEEGLASAKEESTALAESFTNVDNLLGKGVLDVEKLQSELSTDPGLAPRIVAAAEAYVLSTDKADEYRNLLNEIATVEKKREKELARLAVLDILEKERALTSEEVKERNLLASVVTFTAEELEKLQEQQASIAIQSALAAQSTGLFRRQIATIKKLGPGIGKALKQGIVDPFTLGVFSIDAMKAAFADLDKANVNLRRSTGQTVSAYASLELSLVTQVDILKVANALTEELGRNAMNIFPDKILHDVAEFEKMLGLSAKEAGMLGVAAQITGRSMDDIGGSIVDTVNNFNRANKSAVTQGQVLKDVANASAGVSASLGKNPEALAKAAVEARRLGFELDKLDQIASSLLDFESSIENELSAQLLTGKEINLNKARELALTNDLAGLGQELFKNSSDLNEFSRMNRIQQEGLAKALGMSRDELGRTAYLRALDAGMTEKQAAAAANVGLEDMKRLEVQQQLQASMEKISQALVGPAATLASMAESGWMLYTAMGLIATVSLTRTIMSLASMAGFATTTALSLSFGAAAATIAAGFALVYAAQKKAEDKAKTSIQDGVINPDGGLMVSGPKGSIQLDPQDSIVAGTNLRGTGPSAQSNQELIRKIDELISAVKQGGNVYLDGDRVGTALVKGTYRNS